MAVLHDSLPIKVWMDARLSRLPGIQPLDPQDWLRVDEAYSGQLAEKERLIRTVPDQVHALLPNAKPAARELLAHIETLLPGLGFSRRGDCWRCPDGRDVRADSAAPLLSLGRLLQEDFCLLQSGPDGHHVLTGALLCFPASWTLSEKIGRGLPGIHSPVATYDTGMTARVQRLFDAIRPQQPLWRANALAYRDPALFQPRPESEKRPSVVPRPGDPLGFIRAERQCLVRLPISRAVVFSIHTYLVARESLSADEEREFRAWQHPA